MGEETRTFKEAVHRKFSHNWKSAMQDEIDSLMQNKTWILVDTPQDQKLVGSKWIYKVKEGLLGVEEPRFKVRLVTKRFTQKKGID